jgi:hypothetical protein
VIVTAHLLVDAYNTCNAINLVQVISARHTHTFQKFV